MGMNLLGDVARGVGLVGVGLGRLPARRGGGGVCGSGLAAGGDSHRAACHSVAFLREVGVSQKQSLF